ncbi:MAG TPA: YgjV family protein [Polyangia bacterium]
MIDVLGWAATAVFVGSYFFKRPESLRRVQMLGALMWVAYGVLMQAAPVVVANVLVLAAALWTARRGRQLPTESPTAPM